MKCLVSSEKPATYVVVHMRDRGTYQQGTHVLDSRGST